jgi:hypothetical protein
VNLKAATLNVELAPMRLINLYFLNFHKTLNKQAQIVLPATNYWLAHETLYAMNVQASLFGVNGTDLSESINDHFYGNICNLITCDPNSGELIANSSLYYLTERYEYAFGYMRSIITKLPKMSDPKSVIIKWLNQNFVVEIIRSMEYVVSLM